jgi:hypothetical protein
MKVPGPGHYNLNCQMMDKDGKYYISNLKNSMCRSFTHQFRDGIMSDLKSKSNYIRKNRFRGLEHIDCLVSLVIMKQPRNDVQI